MVPFNNAYETIQVWLGRTNEVEIDFGEDVSTSSVSSQIREEPNSQSPLIAQWTSSFKTNGADGVVVLKLQPTDLSSVTEERGYMDIKRVVGGESVVDLDNHIKVIFIKPITT